MKPLVSVIIPTFNASTFIIGALNSIAAQSLDGIIEVIIADSASTDGTADIARSFSSGNVTVKVIEALDCTPGEARNRGIDAARSDYVAFCDADDLMKADMLATMLSTAIDESADVVVVDFDMVYPERLSERFAGLSDAVFMPEGSGIVDYYYQYSAAPKPNNYVWARLYRKAFLDENHLRFSDARYSEDHLFNMAVIFKSPRICHVGRALYRYIQHDDSAMRTYTRNMNHGELFLSSLQKADEVLAMEKKQFAEPVMAIYAYTRLKSILFYAWMAGLSEEEVEAACTAFTGHKLSREYLHLCIDKDYIGHYCKLHGLSPDQEESVRALLAACIEGGTLPDMREVFS